MNFFKIVKLFVIFIIIGFGIALWSNRDSIKEIIREQIEEMITEIIGEATSK